MFGGRRRYGFPLSFAPSATVPDLTDAACFVDFGAGQHIQTPAPNQDII